MRKAWLTLVVLTLARTAMGFQFESMGALSPLLVQNLGISYAAVGMLVGLYLLPGVVVALPVGLFAQGYGDKLVTCIGLCGMVAGGLLTAASESVAVLMAGRLISGAGAVAMNVLASKMVADEFQSGRRGTALGILVTGWPLGIALALVSLPRFAGAFSCSAAMFGTASLNLFALLLVLGCCPNAARGGAVRPRHRSFDLTGREFILSTTAGLLWTLYNFAFVAVLSFGPTFLVASGMKVESANAVVSATSWVAIPAAPLGAWLAQRTNCPSGMIMTCLLLASVAISCVAHWGGSWAWFVAIGLLFGPPGGLIMTLPTEVVAPQRGAVAMGVFFTCYYAGLGILPAVAGYLRDLSHSAASPLWFAVLLLLFATLSLIAFRVFQSRRRCIRAEG